MALRNGRGRKVQSRAPFCGVHRSAAETLYGFFRLGQARCLKRGRSEEKRILVVFQLLYVCAHVAGEHCTEAEIEYADQIVVTQSRRLVAELGRGRIQKNLHGMLYVETVRRGYLGRRCQSAKRSGVGTGAEASPARTYAPRGAAQAGSTEGTERSLSFAKKRTSNDRISRKSLRLAFVSQR